MISITAARSLILTASAALAVAIPAAAGTIAPPPVYEGNYPGGSITGDGTYTSPGVSVTVASQPGASINVQVVGLGPNDSATEYYGVAYMSYDVVINGGTYGEAVPLEVSGSLSTSSLGADGGDVTNSSASLGLSFANGNYGASANVGCGNVLRGEDCSTPTWSGTLSAIGWADYPNIISISASGTVESSGYANAFADPYVFIDPTFLAANPGLSLSMSVGNTATAATPEPSTFLLAATSLFGLLGIRRVGLSAKILSASFLQILR